MTEKHIRRSHTRPYKREYERKYTARCRVAMLDAMGNKCVQCGFSDRRALQVDHIHSDGSGERTRVGPRFWKKVLESHLRGDGKYQLLCANCNCIKRYTHNEFISWKRRAEKNRADRTVTAV